MSCTESATTIKANESSNCEDDSNVIIDSKVKEALIGDVEAEYANLKLELENTQKEHGVEVKKLNSEIENLRKQKTELEEANKALTEELKQFKKDNNNIDGGKSVDVVEKDNKINHLESEIRDLNEKISFYEVQLRDAYKESESFRTQMIEYKTKSEHNVREEVEKHVETYLQQVTERDNAISELELKNRSLQSKLTTLEIQNTELQKTADKNTSVELVTKNVSYHSDFGEKDTKITALEYEIRRLKDKIAVSDLEKSSFTYHSLDYSSTHSNVASEFEKRVEGYLRQLSEKDTKISGLEFELQSLRQKYSAMEYQLTEGTKRNDHGVVVQIEAKTEAYRREIADKDSKLTMYEYEMKHLKETIVDLEGQLKNAYGERDAIRTQLVDYKTQNERFISTELEKRVEVYLRQISERDTRISALEFDLRSLREKMSSMEYELSEVHNRSEHDLSLQIENRTENYRKDIAEKESKVIMSEYEIRTLKERISTFEYQIKEMQKQNESNITLQIESQTAIYTREIAEKDNRLKSMEYEIRILQEKLSGYEGQLREAYKERDTFRSQVFELKSSHDTEMKVEVEKRVEMYLTQITERDSKISGLMYELSIMRDKYAALEYRMAEESKRNETELVVQIETKTESYRREIADKDSKLNMYEYELIHLREKISGFEIQLKEAFKERDSFRSQVYEFKSTTDNTVRVEVEKRTEMYLKQLTEKDSRISILEQEVRSFREKIIFIEMETSQAKQKNEYEMSIQIESKTEHFRRDIADRDSKISSYEYEICMLKEKISTLEYRITEVQKKSDQDALVQIHTKTEVYRKEVVEKENVIAGLEYEIRSLREKLSGFEIQLRDSYKERDTFRTEIYELKSTTDNSIRIEVEKRTEMYMKQLAEKDSKISAYEYEIRTLKEKIHSFEFQITEVQKKSEYDMTIQIESKTESYRREIADRESKISAYEYEIRMLKEKITAMEYRITEAQKKSEHDTTIMIETRTESFRREITEKEGMISSLQFEIQSLREKISGFDVQLRDAFKERDTFRSQIFELKSTSDNSVRIEVEKRTEMYMKQLTEKDSKISAYEYEIRTLREKIYSFEFQITEVQKKSEYDLSIQIESKTESYRREIADRESKISAYEYEIGMLKEKITAMEYRITEAQKKSEHETTIMIETRTESFRREITEKEGMISSLQFEIKSLREKISGFEVQLRDSYKERDTFRTEIYELKSTTDNSIRIEVEKRTEMYMKQLAEKDSKISAYEYEIRTLKEKIHSFEFQITEVQKKSEYDLSIQIESKTESYRREIADRDSKISAYGYEIRMLKEKITAMEYRITEAQKKSEHDTTIMIETRTESFRREITEKEGMISSLQFEIQSLREKISGFDVQLRDAFKERDTFRSQVFELKSTSDNSVRVEVEKRTEMYMKQLAEKDSKISAYEYEIRIMKEKITSLEFQITENQAQSEHNTTIMIETKTESFRREISEKEGLINSLQFEVRSLREKISGFEVQLRDAFKERDSFRTQVYEFKSAADNNVRVEVEKRTEMYIKQLAEKDSKVSTYEFEIRDLRNKVSALEYQITDVQKKSEHETTIMIETKTESFRREITEKDGLISSLQFEVRSLKEKISGFEVQLREAFKERDTFRTQIYEFKSTSDNSVRVEVEKRTEMYMKQLTEKDSKLSAYEIEIRDLKGKISTLEYQIVEIQKKSHYDVTVQIESKTESFRREIAERESKISAFEYEIRILKEKIKAMEYQVTEAHKRSAHDVTIQIESKTESFRREIAERESRISSMEYENKHLREKLSSFEAQLREAYKERDSFRTQIVEVKSKSDMEMNQTIESRVEVYRKEIYEKESTISGLRSEVLTLRGEIDRMKRDHTQFESYKLKYEDLIREKDSFSKEKYSFEFENRGLKEKVTTLEFQLKEIQKERDSIRSQVFQYKSSSEQNVSVQIESRVAVYRKEIQEKDLMITSLRSEIESLKRELVKIKSEQTSTQSISVYQTKNLKLEQDYNMLLAAKEKLEDDMDNRIKQALWEKQEYCYKLEKEIRELKAEIEYYTTNTEGKDAMVSDLRLKISANQREVESLKKQLYVAEEAYEKAEIRLKEVLQHDYKPVSSYVVRRTVRATSGGSDVGANEASSTTAVTKTVTSVNREDTAYNAGISATSTPKAQSPEHQHVLVEKTESAQGSSSQGESTVSMVSGSSSSSSTVAGSRRRTTSAGRDRPTSTYNFNVGRSTGSYAVRSGYGGHGTSGSSYYSSRPTAASYSRYTRKYNS